MSKGPRFKWVLLIYISCHSLDAHSFTVNDNIIMDYEVLLESGEGAGM